MDEKKTLAEVREHMMIHHNFDASWVYPQMKRVVAQPRFTDTKLQGQDVQDAVQRLGLEEEHQANPGSRAQRGAGHSL